MDIGIPLRELGTIDSSVLRETILNQDRVAWGEDQYRQDEYEVHRQTESIVLLFTDGADWPDSKVRKEPGWDRLADVALPLMQEIIDKHYPQSGTIIRAMAAKLLVVTTIAWSLILTKSVTVLETPAAVSSSSRSQCGRS